MDKLRAMQTFVSIADSGSLTAAARGLDSSLPSVVRSLAALERELGVRLFNRTTRRIALTEEGRSYLESCRNVLAAVDDAERTASAGAALPSGNLTVTAPVLFGQMHVTPAITRFLRRYPAMRVHAVLLDRMVNLFDEGIDVGIRIGSLKDSSLIAQSAGKVRRVVVASPAYLRRHGTPRHPNDLLQANCCVCFPGGALSWTFSDRGKRIRVPVRGNLKLNHVAPIADACAEGLGFGLFLSYQVAPYVRRKQLKIVLESFEPPPYPIHIVYPQARLLPARARVFIDWIRHELRAFQA